MEHYYKAVPGYASFIELYKTAVELAPSDRSSTFVEIGAFLGRSAAFMGVEILNSGKPITMHCVDPWTDGGPDQTNIDWFKKLGKRPRDAFDDYVRPVSSVIKAHEMISVEASRLFHDTSVDFIMIDGDHSYEAVRDDLAAWMPKMNVSGLVSGDDYLWPGVKRALEERFGVGGVQTYIKKQRPDYWKSVSYWWKQLP